jgi:uncharacterized protein
MIKPELLEILRCPETHQKVNRADAVLMQKLNHLISEGKVRNKVGQPVGHQLEEGLIREDRKVLYPVRNNIPVMLIDEGISVGELC